MLRSGYPGLSLPVQEGHQEPAKLLGVVARDLARADHVSLDRPDPQALHPIHVQLDWLGAGGAVPLDEGRAEWLAIDHNAFDDPRPPVREEGLQVSPGGRI